MKILHIIYTNAISGAEKYLLDLLPALNKLGLSCELICICPKNSSQIMKGYCDNMDQMGAKANLLTVKSKRSFLKIAGAINKYTRQHDIHVIHSHLFSADFIGVFIKKFYNRKITLLSTKHGYEESYLVQYGLGNKKINHNLYYYITRYVIKNIDHNLAVSNALSKLYLHLKLCKSKMHFIHHGINLQPSDEKKANIDGTPKILMVGRLFVIKGHTYLLQALPQVVKAFPKLKVVLVGDGPLKNKLIQEAAVLQVLEHLQFVGFGKPEDYTSQCQLMVLPSLFESFGLVYIESFALKIPVIAFEAEAVNEIIDNNETGILTPKGDVSALAEKIIYLLSSSSERERISTNAYDKYVTYYNVERMAKETADWYREIIAV